MRWEQCSICRLSGFSSFHSLVTNFLLADGSVRRIRNNYSADLMSRLGSRNDGSLISESEF